MDSEDTAPKNDVLQTGSCFIRCEIEDQVLRLQVVDISQLFTDPEEATNEEPRLELPRTLRHVGSNLTVFSNTTCFANRTLTCTLACQNVPVSSVCPSSDQGDVAVDTTFVWIFVSFFLASAAFSPIYSLADAATFALLGKHRLMYGKQRLWGTVGLAISAVTCTFVINHLRHAGRAFSYDVMFYMFGGFCLLSTVTAYFIDMDVNVKGESLVKNVLKIVIVPEVAAFLVVVLYVGMLSGALQGFLFWYLADLGASPLLFGLCLAVNCLFEIPFFFISGSFINRFGTIACLSCTLLVLSARFMAYSLLSNAWHVLFIEWVHGLTFGVTWSAVTTHASSISPPGLTATTQGLVSGLNFGIGKGLGSLLTGALFSKIGPRWTFRALSITCVCLVIVYVTLHRCVFHGKASLMPDGKDKAYTTGATDKEQQAQNKSLLIPEKPDINC
ncbi:major facilitator superfamily domain-containing protein 6-like [Littorina saxatilis]|uniref:major facilitator superfamily domain-containing protein 6-like n=1 Tax=Littorina saxatilis TaxID=31220 RepID=UPI0038B69AE7